MHNYRNTYVEINSNNLFNNIKKIINKYNDYNYYIAVVKASCYGHNNLDIIQKIIDAGCNYLAVATLDEALEIRNIYKDIPIICLGIIPVGYLSVAKDNNITVTVNSFDYAKNLIKGIKAHIKVNTGMNRLGINNKEELEETFKLLSNNDINIEGIYTHLYEANNKDITNKQIDLFDSLLTDEMKKNIPIIHISASEGLVNYKKLDYVNGCRLGIIMYGFTSDKSLNLESTFSLYSEVIQINNLKKGESVGYNGTYVAKEDEIIAVVSIGYADGIIRKNTGREVYINKKAYPIVGNICMDMLFVKIDNNVHLNDRVVILKDIDHINEVANYLDTIPYEVLCSVSNRVPRIII